jgi:hypothetical protein
MADVSSYMVNSLEGCRTWVSDKTLVKLAGALGVRVSDLFAEEASGGAKVQSAKSDNIAFLSGLLKNLHKNLRDDLDKRFARLGAGRKGA